MGRRNPDHLLMALAYDGSPFHGIWPQPNVPTVADAIYARLEQALGRRPDALAVVARTDAGVHARVNVATVRLWERADTSRIQQATEDRDDGILALKVRRVPKQVHARGIATRKRYIYRWNDDLDVDAMSLGATHLVGTLDVTALRGRRVNIARCAGITLDRVEVLRGEDGIQLIVEGDRFVRHQVRIMASLLASVGRGERPPDEVRTIVASRDVRHGAWPAPGEGLTLDGLKLRGLEDRWVTGVEELELERVAEGSRVAR